MNEIKPFDDVYFNLVKENLSKFIIYEPDFTHITANWSELVESFSDEIIMQYSVGDYSGDYYFVIKLLIDFTLGINYIIKPKHK